MLGSFSKSDRQQQRGFYAKQAAVYRIVTTLAGAENLKLLKVRHFLTITTIVNYNHRKLQK